MKKPFFTKRILALVMAALFLASACIVSAEYVQVVPFPEEGVIFSDDFNGYANGDEMKTKGPWNYAPKYYNIDTTVGGAEHGNVFTSMPAKSQSGYEDASATQAFSDMSSYTAVNSGKLIWEFEFYAPSGYSGDYKINDLVRYPTVGIGSWASGGYRYIAKMAHTESGPVIWFGEALGNGNFGVLPSQAITADFNTWHKVLVVVDYDNDTITPYLNDAERSITAASLGDLSANSGFNYACIVSGALNTHVNYGTADSASPDIYIDNLKITRMPSDAAISATAEAFGNEVTVTFSEPVKRLNGAAISASDYSVTCADGTTISATDCYFEEGSDTLTLFFGEMLPMGTPCTLNTGGDDANFCWLYSSTVSCAMSNLSFTPPTITKTILDEDFEDVIWPEAGVNEDVAWIDLYQSGSALEAANGENTSSYLDMSDWTIAQDTNEAINITQDTLKGSTALKFSMDETLSSAQGSQGIRIPFDQTITGGVLEVEFDVLCETGRQYSRLAFGLHDISQTNTSYNPWENWGDATFFGGLTLWTNAAKALVTNVEDSRGMIPDYYISPNTAAGNAYRPNSGYGKNAETMITDSYACSEARNEANVHTWKYIIDLENEAYEFYLDGELKAEMDYIPGGYGGAYDAFVAQMIYPANGRNIVDGQLSGTDSITGKVSLLLDNITVTHTPGVPAVESMVLKSIYDTSVDINTNPTGVTTAMTEAVLSFNCVMDAVSAAEEITLTPYSGSLTYTAERRGQDVILSFPDGLEPNTTYTLSYGDVLTASGAPLYARNKTITTGSGEQGISDLKLFVDGEKLDSLSAIKADSTITAEVSFVDTDSSKTLQGGVIVLSAYQDGVLTGTKTAAIAPAWGVRKATAVADATADNFYGADKITVSLYDDLTAQNLLVPVKSMPGNSAYADFNSYDSENKAADVKAIRSARLASGEIPTLETQAGIMGWRLDASDAAGSYISVDLDGYFAEGLDNDQTVTVEIDYYDDSYGGFALAYQGTDGKLKSSYVQMLKTNTWKTATMTLYDASFNDDCKGADFHILANDTQIGSDEQRVMGISPYDVLIGGVRLEKVTDSVSPYDITVTTGKAGNVFVYGQYSSMTFDISYTDPEGVYTAGTAVYTVKRDDGTTALTRTQNFTNGQDTLSFGYADLPKYGVYTLEIDVSGNGVSQKKIVDFASSLPGVTNARYGTNLHYDWEVYSQQNIKDQIDLVDAAGFGITRSKIDWQDVEPNGDGQFTIPSNIVYANRYLDELGLENLAILNQQNWNYIGNDWYDGQGHFWLTTQEQRDAFADFAAHVVSEEGIGNYTKYFSIGNEFNLQGPGGMHPYDHYISNHNADNYTHYVNIVKTAYPAIMAENPNARVIIGEVGRYEDEWMEACFDNGLADYCHIMSYHVYERATGPEYYVDYLQPYNDGTGNTWHNISPWATAVEGYKMITGHTNSQGTSIRPWITETGLPSKDPAVVEDLPEIQGTDMEQARWLVRYFALLGYEVDKVFNYNFTNNNLDYFGGENNFGIIRSHDARTPFAAKPAYVAISTYNHFTGSENFGPVPPTYIGTETDRRERGYKLTYPNTQYGTTIMAWKGEKAGTKTAVFSIPDANNLYVYDMYGNWIGQMANGGTWTLTENPIYVVKAN